MITLENGDCGTYEVTAEDGRSVLVQTDWDYPGTARTFGWNMAEEKCAHTGTDGTVNCPDCGKTATAFISEAGAYLDDNIGAEAEDPGYFD